MKYKFELNDLIALIDLICVIGIIMGLNMCIPFIVASVMGLIIALKIKKVNLFIINIAFIILNIYYLLG